MHMVEWTRLELVRLEWMRVKLIVGEGIVCTDKMVEGVAELTRLCERTSGIIKPDGI